MALRNAAASDNPFVARIDALGQIVIGDDALRQIAARGGDAGKGHAGIGASDSS